MVTIGTLYLCAYFQRMNGASVCGCVALMRTDGLKVIVLMAEICGDIFSGVAPTSGPCTQTVSVAPCSYDADSLMTLCVCVCANSS